MELPRRRFSSAKQDAGGWTHQSVDLSAWKGQTVTLSFNLQQDAGQPNRALYLDDVTLGSAHPDAWAQLSGQSGAAPGDMVEYVLYYGKPGRRDGGQRLAYHHPAGRPDLSGCYPSPRFCERAGTDLEFGCHPAAQCAVYYPYPGGPGSQGCLGLNLSIHFQIAATPVELELANNLAEVKLLAGWQVFMPVVARMP